MAICPVSHFGWIRTDISAVTTSRPLLSFYFNLPCRERVKRSVDLVGFSGNHKIQSTALTCSASGPPPTHTHFGCEVMWNTQIVWQETKAALLPSGVLQQSRKPLGQSLTQSRAPRHFRMVADWPQAGCPMSSFQEEASDRHTRHDKEPQKSKAK